MLFVCYANFRIGYYINNEYIDEEMRENPPDEAQIDKVKLLNLAFQKFKLTYFIRRAHFVPECSAI